MREGGWQHTLGADLDGATLGVAGLGRLGSRVASIGQAFGMRVCAWSQHLDHEHARAIGVEPVDGRHYSHRPTSSPCIWCSANVPEACSVAMSCGR